MKISEILDGAAELLTPEGAWVQGAFSRDANGTADHNLLAVAMPVCWCAIGAIAETANFNAAMPFSGPAHAALGYLHRHLGGRVGVHSWNDRSDRTQSEVVQTLHEAAAKARAEGL